MELVLGTWHICKFKETYFLYLKHQAKIPSLLVSASLIWTGKGKPNVSTLCWSVSSRIWEFSGTLCWLLRQDTRHVKYNVTNKVNLIVQFNAIISSFKICTSTVHIIFTFHIFHELRWTQQIGLLPMYGS